MRDSPARAQLLADLASSRARLMDAIAGLTEDQMLLPDPGGWSIKGYINHLAACDEFRFQEIRRVSRGGWTTFPELERDMDVWNAIIIYQRSGIPVAQALSDLEAARSLVLEAIAAAPETALSPDLYGNYAIDGSVAHDIGHAADIRAWRAKEGF